MVNRTGNVLATGLGKTVIFSELIRRRLEAGQRSLVLVHREELALQARAKIHSIAPRASVGIVKAERDEWDADVVVASVPTLASRRRLHSIPADRFGLGVADEAHHAAAATWQRTMDYFGAWRGMPWAGFTATMTRGDDKVLGDIWPEVVADFSIPYGIEHGFLVPVVGKRVQLKDLVLDQVRRSRGDYTDGDLGRAMHDADAGPLIAKAYLEHCPGRRAALFCPTVATAQEFAEDLNEAGIPTEVITGETASGDRQRIYENFRVGRTLVVASCMVLTEGWDAPWAEVAIMARPTSLPGLYAQCVGRVLRPFPAGGKTSALVLDVVGVSEKHGLASLIDLVGREANPYDDAVSEPGQPGLGPLPVTPWSPPPDGELVVTDVDLFTASESAWKLTNQGLWFLATASSYFFLWPKGDGTFTLGRKAVRAMRRHKSERLEDGVTLEGGMAWAERYAWSEDDAAGKGNISRKKASWRKSPPSHKLLSYAAGLGIRVDPEWNQGQVSDQVTISLASATLPTPREGNS